MTGFSGPLLEVRGLKKHFPIRRGVLLKTIGQVKAVDGVDFQVGHRETLGLVGESGCGKSTVGRTLLRLIEPTAGEALFEGQNLFGLSPEALRLKRREMQIIFQDPYSSLNPRRTVAQIVGEALLAHGLARGSELIGRVEKVVRQVGLQPEHLQRYPHEFSGGQRQRIGIARALALGPRFIVCDEAVSALDVSIQAQIINLLEELQAELGLSYLFIAHGLGVVRHISRRVAVMYLGRIVEEAETDELFDHPLHPYTRALISAIPGGRRKGEKSTRILLPGDVPSAVAPPSGCHFHSRCAYAQDICRVDPYPPLVTLRGSTHRAACHFVTAAGDGPVLPSPLSTG